MSDSPEHKFISKSLDIALREFSSTRLLALNEADRRTFDYGCLLMRDFSRPLVSQVIWSHSDGIEKDLRTMIFDAGSSLRLYFVRDKIKNRARIDETLKSYREREETNALLRGLRIVPVPEDFDADSEAHQVWMNRYIQTSVSTDLLFGVVFGKLTAADIKIFSQHGGPIGLKFAALQVIDSSGFQHGPTFSSEVGAKGSPLREVIAMLTGVGMIISPDDSIQRVPTLKGRFFLDFARRLEFESVARRTWSSELNLIMRHLGLQGPHVGTRIDPKNAHDSPICELLYGLRGSNEFFGHNLMKDVDMADPKFYSEFRWRRFTSGILGRGGPDVWNDPDDLALFVE